MDWEQHFNTFPGKFDETEFLKQVGKTVNGVPISDRQFDLIIDMLLDGLRTVPADNVLDMCCGNGLITSRLSKQCKFILGIDYSGILIEIAKKYNSASNIKYVNSSIFQLSSDSTDTCGRFTKLYMYEALQCFKEEDFPEILSVIRKISTDDAIVYLGSIPDIECIWSFYNTPARKAEYYRRKEEGNEAIGTWWNKEYLMSTALAHGFSPKIIQQSPELHSAHYRFDLKLSRRL